VKQDTKESFLAELLVLENVQNAVKSSLMLRLLLSTIASLDSSSTALR